METERFLKLSIEALLVLAILGYLGINFTASIPRAIVLENILYAVIYAALLIGIAKDMPIAYLGLVIVAAFNAGRVSRSIWDPITGWGSLAVQHAPLLTLLLILSILPALHLARAYLR